MLFQPKTQIANLKKVILAAGMGTRLGSQTEDLPKTLVPVGDKPLLGHILDRLHPFNPDEIIIITGFQSDQILHFLKNNHYPVTIVFNPHFQEGSVLTLMAAHEVLQDHAFVVMNADHVFDRNILLKSFEPTDNITAICDSDRNLMGDDMKVKTNEASFLSVMDKKLPVYDKGYIGMTVVPQNKSEIYFDFAKKTLEKNGRFVHVEQILNELAKAGEKVAIKDVSGSTWFEVDTAEDLEKAQGLIGKMV